MARKKITDVEGMMESHEIPEPKRCSWTDTGQSCGRPGYISNTIRGGGPWYCRDHWSRLHGQDKYQVRDDTSEPIEIIDQRVNQIVPRNQGESEHDWSMRCREWVLTKLTGLAPKLQAEPGEFG